MSAGPTPHGDQVTIDDEERAILVALLEQALGDTRVEVRRTHTPDFRDEMLHKEDVVRRLLGKLKSPEA